MLNYILESPLFLHPFRLKSFYISAIRLQHISMNYTKTTTLFKIRSKKYLNVFRHMFAVVKTHVSEKPPTFSSKRRMVQRRRRPKDWEKETAMAAFLDSLGEQTNNVQFSVLSTRLDSISITSKSLKCSQPNKDLLILRSETNYPSSSLKLGLNPAQMTSPQTLSQPSRHCHSSPANCPLRSAEFKPKMQKWQRNDHDACSVLHV